MEKHIKKIKDVCVKVKKVGLKINEKFNPDLNPDLNYMCKVFLERQLSQMASLIKLENYDDLILIARSMFEGGLYLVYSKKYPEMCHKWRMYTYVIDIKRIEKIGDNSTDIPEEVRKNIEDNIDEVERLFKKNNGTYHHSWHAPETIRSIATKLDNEHNVLNLYDKYYSRMSEYHHWGVASLVRRYKICHTDKIEVIDTDELKLERINAMYMAVSSLFITLSLSVQINQDVESIKLINDLEYFMRNLDGTKVTEISKMDNL